MLPNPENIFFLPVLRIRIRDPVPFRPVDPGSGIGLFRIPDLGSRIPDFKLIFLKALKFGPNFFLQQFKNKIILHYVKFLAPKKDMTTNFFSPLSCSCFWIRDPGMGKNQDPGSGINIPDPQHCFLHSLSKCETPSA
jgi:hypothetical protein